MESEETSSKWTKAQSHLQVNIGMAEAMVRIGKRNKVNPPSDLFSLNDRRLRSFLSVVGSGSEELGSALNLD